MPQCVSPWLSASSIGIIILMFSHLVWRSFHNTIRQFPDDIEVLKIKMPIKIPVGIFNELHPWLLSDRVLWASFVVLCAAVLILLLSPLPSFLSPGHVLPSIEHFDVRYSTGSEKSLRPNDILNIRPGQSVLVRAVFLGDADVQCAWFRANGSALTADGCSIIYDLPLLTQIDSLTIRIGTPCTTDKRFSGLFIRAVP